MMIGTIGSIDMKMNEDANLDILFNYVKCVLSPQKVNVVVKTFNDLSPLSIKIAQKVNQDFVSATIDSESIAQIDKENPTDDQRLSYGKRHISERNSLFLAVTEFMHGSNVTSELIKILENFNILNVLSRGKYLLNIITEKDSNLEHFLRYAWSWKFIDLTVIQWIREPQLEGTAINSRQNSTNYQVFVHSYNLFTGRFKRELLTTSTELFPKKLKNLHGFPLTVMISNSNPRLVRMNPRGPSYHGPENFLVDMVMDALNSSLIVRTKKTAVTLKPDHNFLHGFQDFILPISNQPIVLPSNIEGWELRLIHHLAGIRIPIPGAYHFYLMRQKTYGIEISYAAILTFGGLIFTAFIFAMWARLLGLRDPNWSFLNILTAQMGGSTGNRSRMKLSEMIFQMSIYIATFIIVTLGADYMYTIFISYPELSNIKTMADLAKADVSLFMDETHYNRLKKFGRDVVLEKIFVRIRVRNISEGSHLFCDLPTSGAHTFDRSINLCLLFSRDIHHILESNYEWQVDKIEDPVLVIMPTMMLGTMPAIFKYRFEELISRFLEVGLLDLWTEVMKRNQLARLEYKKDTSEDEKKEDEGVPLHDQLWPVFVVGYPIAVIALIGELIWKRFVEKTRFGRLMMSFNNQTQSRPAHRRFNTNRRVRRVVSA
ncbi:hypothetical protein QAD02_004116 [Eretmocerus hayati]|uniref:Uncharacterized protein n=2 Tax=Eretmocerus hayati TaxID=131215 RepID=A0ACC2NP47_9HYME|nr:hypothetical protein QAD02_004114 [Eretmocerus hayati]KAJ8672856.1 hypothetical protein QAD02_004116 [Eretmocerus hayati]